MTQAITKTGENETLETTIKIAKELLKTGYIQKVAKNPEKYKANIANKMQNGRNNTDSIQRV